MWVSALCVFRRLDIYSCDQPAEAKGYFSQIPGKKCRSCIYKGTIHGVYSHEEQHHPDLPRSRRKRRKKAEEGNAAFKTSVWAFSPSEYCSDCSVAFWVWIGAAEVSDTTLYNRPACFFKNTSKLMSSSKTCPCHCPKCNGMLVSVRAERNHRNGPAIRQFEAAQRKPGRQKHRRTVAGPSLSSHDNPELPEDHANTGAGDGGVDVDMDNGRDQIVVNDALPVRHSIFLWVYLNSVFTNWKGVSQLERASHFSRFASGGRSTQR